MKFLCIKCNSFMDYESKEQVDTLRLGITFACIQCGYKVAMVTNPGETQLVSGLGVKIGGRTVPAEPMEFTREAIKPEGQPTATMTADMGKCPFPSMLSGSAFKDSGIAAAMSGSTDKSSLPWTATAEQRLQNVPSFVRSLAKAGVEQYAKENGYGEINDQVMTEYREKVGM
ncbi:MAG TPA: PCP reductase family protein [Nitrospiria bacterium]